MTVDVEASEPMVHEEVQYAVHNEVQEDTLHASQSAALEDVRELLSSTSNGESDPKERFSDMDDDETKDTGSETLPDVKRAQLLEYPIQDNSAPDFDDDEIPLSPQRNPFGQENISELLLQDPSSPIAPQPSPLTPHFERPGFQVSKAEPILQYANSSPTAGLEAPPFYPNLIVLANADSSSPKLEAAIVSPKNVGCHSAGEHSPAQLEAGSMSPGHMPSTAESAQSAQLTATPSQASAVKLRRSKHLIDPLSPGGSPQIGTSLLRRESLRNKETPSKKRDSRKIKNAKKRDTLSRRDTLQEREILQKVIAETDQDPSQEDADHAVAGAPILLSEDLVLRPEQTEHDKSQTTEVGDRLEKPADDDLTGRVGVSVSMDVAKLDKDVHRAMEAIEVFEHPTANDAEGIATSTSAGDIEEVKAIDQANEMIAVAELEEATHTVETIKEQTEQPSRKTRSAARFSDDTSMLRDFLNRAQASKAAKTPTLSPLDAPKPQISPRRSPRKALGPHVGSASTPQKPGDIANRPGTPPGSSKNATIDSDDAEDRSATPTSCRRSTRSRLPAPSKAPPGAPSFIPVRRADGTDPVVLQKSQAQEIAIVTRANTRRNKGQSKPPLLALKDLPADSVESMKSKQRAENAKSVGWAERLASYQDAMERADEVEEIKPKVRRMRGLGAVNGTPAAKKTAAVVGTSNGTPARRGKVR